MGISPFSRYLVYHQISSTEIVHIFPITIHTVSQYTMYYCDNTAESLCTINSTQTVVQSEPATLLQKYCYSSECDLQKPQCHSLPLVQFIVT